MSKLSKRRDTIYNQNVSNKFSSDCTIFSILQIFGLTYGIWTKYTIANRIVDFFIKIGKLFSWGASFSVIYGAAAFQLENVLARKIKEHEKAIGRKSGLSNQVSVLKFNIGSEQLNKYLKEGYAFGIGLKNGNPVYLNAVREGKDFNIELVDKILRQGGGFGHNNVIAYEGEQLYIYEIYEGEKIKTDIETLLYAANRGLLYFPARSFYIEDDKLRKELMIFNRGENPDVTKDNYSAVAIASNLRVFNIN